MQWDIKIIARVAVFSALVFVFAYSATFFYNINPAFFIVFTAGFVWGIYQSNNQVTNGVPSFEKYPL